MNDSSTFLLPRFNSLLEVKGMTRREGGKRGEKKAGGRREQVDSLINNHKVRQAAPGWVGPVRKQQLRICRACKGLKQHRSTFFVQSSRPLKDQGDTCWWLRGTMVTEDSSAVSWHASQQTISRRRQKKATKKTQEDWKGNHIYSNECKYFTYCQNFPATWQKQNSMQNKTIKGILTQKSTYSLTTKEKGETLLNTK